MQPSTSEYEATFLEKEGVEYQQLVAWFLLQRAMLKNEKFKKNGQVFEFRMAFEMKAAGKFDDVPLFLEDGGYLIQLKHTVSRKDDQPKVLTREMLFSKQDSPFLLHKYLKAFHEMKKKEKQWNYGDIKHIIIFTNSKFEEADSNPEVVLDEIFKFSTGKHIKLTNSAQEMIQKLKENTAIDEATVTEFFSKLVLSVEQPNVEQLKLDMVNESRHWMRTWIRPDDLGRQEESFFEQPLHIIHKEFNEYEKTVQHVEVDGKQQIRRVFLGREKGKEILEKIKNKLSYEIQISSKHSCASLEAMSYYYINRHNKLNQFGMIQDREFIEQLYTTFSNKNCFILTAQPGMGKSTLWQYLAFEAQKLNTESAVFLLYLNNLPHNMPTIEKVEDIMTSKIFYSDLSKSNIELIVKENKKQIVLFFDAFDEIRASQKSVLELFMVILGKSNVKIIISGRQHVKEILERRLNVISLELQEFDRDEQMIFLQKFWKQSADSEKCRTFSQAILDKFHQDISRNDYDFTGVPLMIRMVAEIYAGLFEKYLNSDCELKGIIPSEKLSIISLYDQFSKKCIQITMNKKFNVDNNRELDPFFNPLVEKVDFDYQVLAVERFIFSPSVKDEKHDKIIHSFEHNIENQQSLIVELVQDKPTFTHLSFGEYFAAKYLFNLVYKKQIHIRYDDIFPKIFRREYYENITNFFLAMVDAQISLDSKLNKNDFDWLKKDDDIIWWSCKRDYVEIIKYFYTYFNYKTIKDEDAPSMLQISIENCAKKTENFLLEKGAYQHLVHVAVECNRLDLVEKHISDVNSLDDNGSTPIFRAKCIEIFSYLKEKNADFNIRNKYGDTLLHAMVKTRDLKFIEEIFNFKDSNGFHLSECILFENKSKETPLNVAANRGKIDILIFLFKQSLKNNQIAPLDGNPTLLETCRHYKTEGIMNIAIEQALKMYDIIEACQLIGLDVNFKNTERYTAFHFAAKKNCRQLAEFLHRNGANLYSTNNRTETPLHVAINNYSFEVVEFLVPLMSDIGDLTSSYGNTALHLAAKLEDPKCLTFLLEKNSTLKLSLDMKNAYGESALKCAIHYNKKNVHILIKAGAKPIVNDSEFVWITYLKAAFDLEKTTFNSECKKSKQLLEQFGYDISLKNIKCALHEAAKSGWVELVKFLIAKQFDVKLTNQKKQTPLMLAKTKEMYDLFFLSAGGIENLKNEAGDTCLHIAAQKNCIEIVQYLSEKYQSLVNCKNKRGDTPLHLAAQRGHEEIAAILIKNNADIYAENDYGQTSAYDALSFRHANVVRSILEHSAETAEAVWQGLKIKMNDHLRFCDMKLELVEVLLAAGLNVKKVYENGVTLLHAAAKGSELDVVQLLVRTGADVDALDNRRNTPLHYAVRNYNTDVIIYLTKHSADINSKNQKGETPLHRSIENFKTKATKILLARNACIHLKNNLGETLLHLAIMEKKNDVALLLIDLKANVNEKDNHGYTPLHLAVMTNKFKIVKKLAENGADLSLFNNSRKTALDLAAENRDCIAVFIYLAMENYHPNIVWQQEEKESEEDENEELEDIEEIEGEEEEENEEKESDDDDENLLVQPPPKKKRCE